MTAEMVARRFFLAVLIAALAMLALVVRPLAVALFLAAVLAGFLWPLYHRLVTRFGGRRGLAAAVFVFGVVILLVGPVVSFGAFLLREGAEALEFVLQTVRSDGVSGLIDGLPEPLAGLAHRVLERLPAGPGASLEATVQKQVTAQGGRAAAAVAGMVTATGSLLFEAAMMLIALYFFLLQGDELLQWLDETAPLRRGQTRELLAEFKKVSYAVIVSTVVTAAVQALAALGGFLVARVPHPLFFTAVAFFLAFIPAVGAAVVCVAAAGILLLTGHPYAALFLALWGVVVVGLVDNIVKPFVMKAGMEMRGGVVFFALLGGLAAFGPVGLLIGPLVVALFLALLRIWDRDFRPREAAPVVGAR